MDDRTGESPRSEKNGTYAMRCRGQGVDHGFVEAVCQVVVVLHVRNVGIRDQIRA
jgi:hypothetical protein